MITLTPEQEFKMAVGEVLEEMNDRFKSEQWLELGSCAARLWLLFYHRIKAEAAMLGDTDDLSPKKDMN